MKKYIVGTLIFILVTFIVQSTSHFVINKAHYASVTFMRKEVIFPLGFLTMTLQGLVLTFLFGLFSKSEYNLKNGFYFGLIMAALFVCYPALTEPAKYQVPDILSWILVEGSVGLIQFSLFGILLSLAFRKLN